ncbi:MAG: hypothetical protein A2719_05055 [Candidatus Ryanbacteria bacterium RIFCSPHIGHO2_01_FULL_45_22]|uniref:Methyltransferase domain-containing protein n=1 Tax=Candidatus Ryanbacteria bacterium RIFCSPHIGHO2_01_FULL_45_22 TaxID=1802114 RepID=A0A1G2G2G5_9BACT|nr:MAG: hypothetical protein A2719_05055 [Candidatus Ryanbacteria bacterium RIFCSPHIGHO2_01_FULL_45_22]
MPFLHPSIVTQYLEILPGMRIADFGCGSGHWAIILARAVGSSGTVFAIDVQESALEATRAQARLAHITNVETIRGNVEVPGATMLKDRTVDAVMISNMLFQADEKEKVAGEAARIIKPGGRLFLIDWDPATEQTTPSLGPPLAQRMTRQDAEQLFTSKGFHFEKEFNAGSHHYGLIFRI